MKTILIFCFIIAVVGFGCEKSTFQNAPSSLMNTTWVLSYIQDTKTNAIINYPSGATKRISIVFTSSLLYTNSVDEVLFNGICNGGKGGCTCSTIDGSILVTGIETTLIACKFVEWEGYTVQNLDASYGYKIDGVNLIIYSKGSYNLYFTSN